MSKVGHVATRRDAACVWVGVGEWVHGWTGVSVAAARAAAARGRVRVSETYMGRPARACGSGDARHAVVLAPRELSSNDERRRRRCRAAAASRTHQVDAFGQGRKYIAPSTETGPQQIGGPQAPRGRGVTKKGTPRKPPPVSLSLSELELELELRNGSTS